MTLYELMNAVTVQGHVEIKLFDERGDQKDSAFYEYVEDLSSVELPDGWEDYEVTFLYSEKLERRYWTSVGHSSLLSIEIKEPDE